MEKHELAHDIQNNWYVVRKRKLRRAAGLSAFLLIAAARPGVAQTPPQSRDAASPSTEIATVLGTFGVGNIDIGDRFPPGCDNPPAPDCERAVEGYHILVVWLTPKDGQDLPALLQRVNILDASAHAEVVSEAGTRTERFSFGMRQGKMFVAFAPKATEKNFKLSWPGNPEIALGK